MPTIEENLKIWGDPKNWEANKHGEAWSAAWGTTEKLFKHTILPRLEPIKDLDCIVEIAPGYGRITQHLLPYTKRLVVIDTSKTCIDYCQATFGDKIEAYVTDGLTIPLPADTADLVFSWDSLVHCELDVVKSYLEEAARVLKDQGLLFLHLSNFKSHLDKPNHHMRARSVNVEAVLELLKPLTIKPIITEEINWGADFTNDFFMLAIKTNQPVENHAVVNRVFNLEMQKAKDDKN